MNRFAIMLTSLLFQAMSVFGQPGLEDYLQVAAGFTENRQHLEAISVCDKLLDAFPDNPDVYFLRGINRYMQYEYEGAVDDFNKTLSLFPDYPEAYLYRAKARKANKDYMGAIRDYSKAKDYNFTQTVASLAGDMFKSIFSGSRK
jgi:tetratricopeptide (TPR) repeat protein